jgi:hypothetical protein
MAVTPATTATTDAKKHAFLFSVVPIVDGFDDQRA